ncbi:MAG: hypothetical protein HQ582_13780 [Planctomycetes bacterium]|nr:hypothetical protein [Planctomycetota bacterium]
MPTARRALTGYAAFALCMVIAACVAGRAEGKEPRDSGLNQLVVIQPGAHERGLPAVRLEPMTDGSLKVDIPRTVHVHRYYYDGDKEYQGPIIQGGPTVVVANHPKTGEQMYVNVTLPAGAPEIAYDKGGITYVYPDRRVEVKFSSRCTERVAVKHCSGQGVGRRASGARERITTASREACAGSPTLQAVGELATGGGGVVVGATQGVDTIFGFLVDRVQMVGQILPGAAPLSSFAGERTQRAYENTIRRAQAVKDRAEVEFLPTNR